VAFLTKKREILSLLGLRNKVSKKNPIDIFVKITFEVNPIKFGMENAYDV